MSWSCDAGAVSAAVDTYQYLGTSFVGAVQTFLAAQCALLTPDQWPPDRTDEVLQDFIDNGMEPFVRESDSHLAGCVFGVKEKKKVSVNIWMYRCNEQFSPMMLRYPVYDGRCIADPVFDFVVVGAGSAGSVLANRLTEVSEWKVLLVEAGGLPTLGSEVPGLFFSTVNTSLDWGYKLEPQPQACRSCIDHRLTWPRGRVLGGSSSVNGMYYIRGNANDYDSWEKDGNLGWSYDDVLPYFKKSEDFEGGNITHEDVKTYHRVGGYLHTEIKGGDLFEDIILNANEEAGLKKNKDLNGESQMGVGRSFSTTKNGRKESTARAFLSPIKDRKNLFVITNAMVTEVLFEKHSNDVKGVKISKNNYNFTVFVKKEVIVSAGTINSPQLLTLSGIGPKKYLKKLGIHARSDLSVGFNLQDHTFVPIYYTKTVDDQTTLSFSTVNDYLINKNGALASTKPNRVISFINTVNSTADVPNIENHFYIFPPNFTDFNDYYRKTNFNEEVRNMFKEINLYKNVLQVTVCLIHPDSRGSVQLRSKDPFDHPLIYANYLDKPKDIKTLIAGLKYALKLGQTKTFTENELQLEWFDLASCRGIDRESDEFLECWARELTSTTYHPVGTNKMGPGNDPYAVVDPELKVYGVNGLRVIDASIMPRIPRGNTNAPVIMIAEKGADMIKSDWLSDEYETDDF